jgi:sugar O-acyltransferase (sialic acid O-acetyltransferase NeuD family)
MTTSRDMAVDVPRLNANEDQVLVVRVHVADGDRVDADDLMLEVETTKATAEVVAPAAGTVADLEVSEGELVDVGVAFCRLTDDAASPPPRVSEAAGIEHPLKITSKARKRAAELGVDLDRLPRDGGRVTVEDIEAVAGARDRTATAGCVEPSEPRALVFGAGGHATVAVDALAGQGYRVVGCIDDDPEAKDAEVLNGVRVLGDRASLPSLLSEGVEFAFVGIGGAISNGARSEVFDVLRQLGFRLPALILGRAYVSASSTMGAGTIVLPGAVIGPRCRIGSNVIINQGAQVCHDVVVGDGCHITPGALIAGNCQIGPSSTIGMGAAVLFGTSIGEACLVHNNATVNSDVPDCTEVFGDGRRGDESP